MAVWDVEARRIVAWSVAREGLPLPYRPGRLAYAVSPAITAALLRLPRDARPDALIVHGHGAAHPRRFGLACHLGAIHRLPTAGVAEKLLGTRTLPRRRVKGPEPGRPFAERPPDERGAWRPVTIDGDVAGAALRTRAEASVLYVSPGWGCDVEGAIALVMEATGPYRWPQPVRHARMRLRAAHRRRGDLYRVMRAEGALFGPAGWCGAQAEG